MAGSINSASGAGRPARKRPFPFGLLMLAIGLGLGLWGGIALTKRVMTAPVWIQKLFGLPVPAAPIGTPAAAVAPPAPSVPAVTAPPAAPRAAAPVPTDEPERSAAAANPDDLLGRWEVTDTLPGQTSSSSSVTSRYVFKNEGTGDFEAGGKKLYDFTWKLTGDDLEITYDGEGPDPQQTWKATLKWSLNADRSLLTLVPSGGKDARNFLYGLGAGVYHRQR